ncbi:MAG TPA: amino acid adenylation domain-containing protein, partial [Actinomycetota bacterium]|nr:amino acid adenylation domain-containing protein [Actinomycetota bacterium]
MNAPVSDIVAAVRRHARATPAAPSVVDALQSLSYAALDRRSDGVAAWLRARGVGAEKVVGVLVRRKLEGIVAALGIMKAGGAYLPLESAAPRDRLSFVAEDSGAMLVLTGSGVDAERLPATGAPVVRLDGTSHDQADPRPPARPSRRQAAYVIYTSGTTGRPKGVCVPRGALSAHLRAVAERFGLHGADRVLQFAASHVDVALEQSFAPLMAGAAVVVRDGGAPPPQDLLATIARERLTVVNLPAGYWNELASSLDRLVWPEDHRLRLMVSGSDRMSAAAVARWREHAPAGVRLLNAYGPTEAVITASVYELPPEEQPPAAVPIGAPVGGRTLHILDSSLRPCPVGVPGELFIGGPELARGYVDRPGLTARQFVPDPFSTQPGARLYRTGDVVRRSPEGNLVLLGRTDDQVKVRGFRVEPGEVQAVLSGLPGVRDSAVVAREDNRGQRHLAAYVVSAPERPSPATLRDSLAAALPDYMVPSAVVVVDELPLTPGGKLDTDALPAAPAGRDGAAAYQPPRTHTEQLLAEVWADVLGTARVGVNDDFFALGGDSLAAVRVATRLLPAFGSAASPYAVFQTATLAELAAELDRRAHDHPADLPVLRPRGDAAPAPLSFGQRGLWFMDRWDPGAATYNVPWVFWLSGWVDVGLLQACLNAV